MQAVRYLRVERPSVCWCSSSSEAAVPVGWISGRCKRKGPVLRHIRDDKVIPSARYKDRCCPVTDVGLAFEPGEHFAEIDDWLDHADNAIHCDPAVGLDVVDFPLDPVRVAVGIGVAGRHKPVGLVLQFREQAVTYDRRSGQVALGTVALDVNCD